MRIKYNAPTTLTYALVCSLVVFLDTSVLHGLTRAFFTVPDALSFNLLSPLDYLRLFTHIAGHADWNHLINNFAYILLLGPMLEETYGSVTMALMIVVTGFVTGVLNACFFPHPLLGASGVVFMMILLASFANHGHDDVPLTFILVVILYLGREILNAFGGDDISQFAHLAGGLCGSLFGFFQPPRRSGGKAGIPIAQGRAGSPQRPVRAAATRTPGGTPTPPAGGVSRTASGTRPRAADGGSRPAPGAKPRAADGGSRTPGGGSRVSGGGRPASGKASAAKSRRKPGAD